MTLAGSIPSFCRQAILGAALACAWLALNAIISKHAAAADAPSVWSTPVPDPDRDQPVLRGSDVYVPGKPNYFRWQGFYAGGQFGYAFGSMDFSKASAAPVAFLLRQTALLSAAAPDTWQLFGTANPRSTVWGAFTGYNMQFDNAIVGVEVNYNHGPISADAPVFPLTRATSAGGNAYQVTLNGAASMSINDYGSVRLRGGYAIGNFMPYAALALGIGSADAFRSVTIPLTENGVPFTFSQTEARNFLLYGWGAALGFEYALTPNLFFRGEYEFLQFTSALDMTAQVQTLHVGAGFKF